MRASRVRAERDQFQQGRKWRLINTQDDAGKAQIAELNGEAQGWLGRADYNSVRPHSALGQLAPDQFRQLNQPETGQPPKLRVVYSAG